MRHLKDYDFVEDFIKKTESLDLDSQNIVLNLFTDFSNVTHDYRNKVVCDANAATTLLNIDGLRSSCDIVIGNTIDQQAYLLLYAFYILKNQAGHKLSFKAILQLAEDCPLDDSLPTLSNYLDSYLIAFYFVTTRPDWNDFISDFDPQDWGQISALQQALPLAGLSVQQMSEWITLVSMKQEKDGYLSSIGDSIYSWATRFEADDQLETCLKLFIHDKHLQRFIGPIVTALRERQKNDFRHYWDILKEHTDISNSYAVFYALGTIIESDEKDRTDYFELLVSSLESKILSFGEFIRLCAVYKFHIQTVYELITDRLSIEDANDDWFDLIVYLHNVPESSEWYTSTCTSVFSVKSVRPNKALEGLLYKIVDDDSALAYRLLQNRFSVALDVAPFKNVIEYLATKDKTGFQQMLVEWFSSDNVRLHLALGRICSLHGLPTDIFNVEKPIYDTLSLAEKLFVAYKMAGYIYLATPLQGLFTSLVKSVDIKNDTFEVNIKSLLKNYVIYNYRSTLDFLNEELETSSLSQVARDIFADAIETYERYHAGLQSVSASKELTPPLRLRQYKAFYQTKQFNESNAERNEENSLLALFGDPVSLNSNKWAVRRPGELVHKPSPLGKFEVSMEFPSGEILDPHFQEYMRKSYQKLRKHEIDFE
jgi:hypothetical protein